MFAPSENIRARRVCRVYWDTAYVGYVCQVRDFRNTRVCRVFHVKTFWKAPPGNRRNRPQVPGRRRCSYVYPVLVELAVIPGMYGGWATKTLTRVHRVCLSGMVPHGIAGYVAYPIYPGIPGMGPFETRTYLGLPGYYCTLHIPVPDIHPSLTLESLCKVKIDPTKIGFENRNLPRIKNRQLCLRSTDPYLLNL